MANKSQLKATRLKIAPAKKPSAPAGGGDQPLAGRSAAVERKTRETEVKVVLNLDGAGRSTVATGVPFLDHMLESFARHGFFDLAIQASGDVHIDEHHTVEDVGIRARPRLSPGARRSFWHPAVRRGDGSAGRGAVLGGGRYQQPQLLCLQRPDSAGAGGNFPTELVHDFMKARSDEAG